jgi:hypothetical protein
VDSPEPSTTLVVLLGASEWPQSPKLAAGAAFQNSAGRFRDYILSRNGQGIPQANLKDLFDDPRSPSEID